MPVNIQGIKFYTVAETATELRVTPQTVRRYIKTGLLPSKRIGRPILITDRDLKRLLEKL